LALGNYHGHRNPQSGSFHTGENPYAVINGVQPQIDHLRRFGQPCLVHVPEETRVKSSKLTARSERGYLVGHKGTFIYQIWIPTGYGFGKTVESSSVTFDRTKLLSPEQLIKVVNSNSTRKRHHLNWGVKDLTAQVTKILSLKVSLKNQWNIHLQWNIQLSRQEILQASLNHWSWLTSRKAPTNRLLTRVCHKKVIVQENCCLPRVIVQVDCCSQTETPTN